jgi:hypothetical protein
MAQNEQVPPGAPLHQTSESDFPSRGVQTTSSTSSATIRIQAQAQVRNQIPTRQNKPPIYLQQIRLKVHTLTMMPSPMRDQMPLSAELTMTNILAISLRYNSRVVTRIAPTMEFFVHSTTSGMRWPVISINPRR